MVKFGCSVYSGSMELPEARGSIPTSDTHLFFLFQKGKFHLDPGGFKRNKMEGMII